MAKGPAQIKGISGEQYSMRERDAVDRGKTPLRSGKPVREATRIEILQDVLESRSMRDLQPADIKTVAERYARLASHGVEGQPDFEVESILAQYHARDVEVAEARLLEWFDTVTQQLQQRRKLTPGKAEFLKLRERVVKTASDINAGLEALLHNLEAGNITPAEAKKFQKEVTNRIEVFGWMIKILEQRQRPK